MSRIGAPVSSRSCRNLNGPKDCELFSVGTGDGCFVRGIDMYRTVDRCVQLARSVGRFCSLVGMHHIMHSALRNSTLLAGNKFG
jgi:hypothetical protein